MIFFLTEVVCKLCKHVYVPKSLCVCTIGAASASCFGCRVGRKISASPLALSQNAPPKHVNHLSSCGGLQSIANKCQAV